MNGPGTITFVCRKCTRQQSFFGSDQQSAVQAAKLTGWAQDDKGAVCPKCPARRTQ